MSYIEKLKKSAKERKSIVCMGLDPVLESFPEKYKNNIDYFQDFIDKITTEMIQQKVFPGAFKPNQGFYVKHNSSRDDYHDNIGTVTLKAIMRKLGVFLEEVFLEDIPQILDFKRGDIAASSANYADEGFDVYMADAVTVSPYMGTDSVMPFIEKAIKSGGGVYILNRTSNKGAKDLQDLITDYEGVKMPFYQAVSMLISKWAVGHPGVGAVVGATSPKELKDIAGFYAEFAKGGIIGQIPLLIPGVGSQGGSAKEVVQILKDVGYDLGLVRINSSSGLTHPWHKKKLPCPEDYPKTVVEELHKLNEEIGYVP